MPSELPASFSPLHKNSAAKLKGKEGHFGWLPRHLVKGSTN